MAEYIWETAEEINQSLAERVRKIRKRRSISQEKLSLLSGVSFGTVFCKYFLDKVAKHFWTLLHVQIGQSCKALASHDQTSHLMPCRHF